MTVRCCRRIAAGILAYLVGLMGGLAGAVARHLRVTRNSPLTMWEPMYVFFRWLFRVSFVIWGRWKIKGRSHLPSNGGYIVAANHVSFIDPPIVGGALIRPAYFMAKAELFKTPVFGDAIPLVGAYPVKRGSPDRAAVKRTLDLLSRGEVVSIFPEGTRRPPGELGDAESGFGWLVYKARVPVVPIGITGSADLLPRGARFLKTARVRVHIGEPLNFDDLWDAPDSRQAMKEIGVRTMTAIQSLIRTADDQ
ncbi:MAG TPA: lysophospholipid acyltransferase family protein [Armatimonadota bacterium]|nr:lysophospholipid acyltransferase family protein [Armatimonadota bacterium]